MFCTYCNDIADTIDHTVPLYYTNGNLSKTQQGKVDNGYDRVPCCRECNSLLGPSLIFGIQDRAKYLHKLLRKRYNKLIRMPHWTVEELLKLEPSLQETIKCAIQEANKAKQRIAYCQSISNT